MSLVIPEVFYLRKVNITIKRGRGTAAHKILYVYHNWRHSINGMFEVSKGGDARKKAKRILQRKYPEAQFWR